jgi:hypothetical protein
MRRFVALLLAPLLLDGHSPHCRACARRVVDLRPGDQRGDAACQRQQHPRAPLRPQTPPQHQRPRIRAAGMIRPRGDASRGAVLHDGCMTFTTFAPSQSLIAREILRKAPGRPLAQDQVHVVRVAKPNR